MAVDPNAPPGLPSANGPMPMPPGGMVPPGPPGVPGDPNAGAMMPPQGFPSTDPGAMMAVIQAAQAADHAQLQQEQDQAAAAGITMLLRQQPNVPGEAATTLPGSPTPPPMPAAPGMQDSSLGDGSGY